MSRNEEEGNVSIHKTEKQDWNVSNLFIAPKRKKGMIWNIKFDFNDSKVVQIVRNIYIFDCYFLGTVT